ncbi:MAG: FkbM family methyltransferase [Rhodoblastus sp.]|nr:FkbM family methyltransferase [Rhodoblastus sp.]
MTRDNSNPQTKGQLVEGGVSSEHGKVRSAKPNSTVATINHLGVELFLDPAILSPLLMDSIKSGRYEHVEASEIKRIIQKGERVIELGAGIGFISTLIARNPHVEALRVFEANPDLVPYIRRVHEANNVSRAEVVNAVLANDLSGGPTRNFYIRRDFWASSLTPEPWAYTRVEPVQVRSFNAEIEQFRPTLIVCDIEGGELELFMQANLTGVRKVYLEVHQRVLGRAGMKQLFDAFSARGFHYDQHHSKGSVILFSHVKR